MLFLKGMDFGGKRLGSICREYLAGGLEEDLATVVYGIGKMDCDARLFFSRFNHCLVHIHSVHPLSAKLGQQGRVDVDDLPGISFCYGLRHLQQISCKNDCLYAVSFQYAKQPFRVCSCKLLAGEDHCRNIKVPGPIQNETIRIEIVDLERQETEDYPLVNKGEALPCSASHNFKINEYSREQIILPVKEGYREIYSLIIDVPENTPLGSRVTVNTEIDVLGKVTLKVLLNNKEIEGKVVYAETKDMDDSTLMDIEEKFYDKIENVRGEAKAEFVARQENITREINEAVANSDKNHYTDALNKYETLVRELPSSISDLTEEDFDELERELKDLASQQDDIT